MAENYTGLWIPREILVDSDLTHIEKIVWSLANALPNGLKMADQTIAEQTGTSKRNVSKVLKNLVSKGYLKKDGSHNHRSFLAITPQGVIQTTPQSVIEESNYPSKCNQLPLKVQSITPRVRHKEYKTKENKEGEASAKKVETNVDKDEALEESNTSQQAATSLWMTYMNPATGRNFMSKPKLGTWIYNPATGESKEYEGE